jgi:hypothetical protein
MEEKRQTGLWLDRPARVIERLDSRARKRGKRNALWKKSKALMRKRGLCNSAVKSRSRSPHHEEKGVWGLSVFFCSFFLGMACREEKERAPKGGQKSQ